MGRMTSLFSYGKTCLKPPATYHSGTLPEQTKEGMLRPAGKLGKCRKNWEI